MKIAAKTPAAAEKPAVKKDSMAALLMGMVVAGKSNAEMFAAAEKAGLPKEHRWYISWYRWNTVRKGLCTKAFAKEHAGKTERAPKADKPAPAKAVKKAPAKVASKKAAKKVVAAPAADAAE